MRTIEEFVGMVQQMLDTHYADAKVAKPKLSIERGKKYAKIVRSDDGVKTIDGDEVRSVYGFVEISTGNILKAASWKVPAKGIRGNIHSDDCLHACTPYGIVYRR